MTARFTDTDTLCYLGENAEAKLAQVNDVRYWARGGIRIVPRKRWDIAQEYERRTWLEFNLKLKDDHNVLHTARFDNYAVLHGRAVGSAIEVGCGPFTNLRYILPHIECRRAVLLDPLASEYQTRHPHCTYATGSLGDTPVEIVSVPLEQYEPEERFGLVVAINLIQHCADFHAVERRLFRFLAPGGVLVFAERYFRPGEHDPESCYDAGHPLVVPGADLDGMLTQYTEIYRKEEDWDPLGVWLYFIGERDG